ncbi:MAG TPA: hypothetical protein VL326_31500 [Kofleriaceae bacterium]|jgi:hypothetical protein|nr:hypothetical protein [Kofleriaceae bacterium]
MSDEEPQFSNRDVRMAELALELRLGIRLLARAIACFAVAPLIAFIAPRPYSLIIAGVMALAGIAHLALGLKHKRAADRGMLAMADKAN